MSTPRWAQLCIDKSALLSQVLQKAADLQEAISEGATSFLLTEFKYMGVFMVSSVTPSARCPAGHAVRPSPRQLI